MAASLGTRSVKSSAGADRHMLVALVSSVPNAIGRLKRPLGLDVGTDMDGVRAYYDNTFKGLTAPPVVSAGRLGPGPRAPHHFDDVVSIPPFGRTPSINASVSAAILIYEVVRQRGTVGADRNENKYVCNPVLDGMMKKDADFKCEYCGAILELEKVVRFEPDSGEYKYVCTSCAGMDQKRPR